MLLDYLSISYILTIVTMRVFLTFYPIHFPKIGNFQPHHYMHGLILVTIYSITAQPILLAVGSALVVDEIPLLFKYKTWRLPSNHWETYHSWKTIVAVIIISLLGFLILSL